MELGGGDDKGRGDSDTTGSCGTELSRIEEKKLVILPLHGLVTEESGRLGSRVVIRQNGAPERQ